MITLLVAAAALAGTISPQYADYAYTIGVCRAYFTADDIAKDEADFKQHPLAEAVYREGVEAGKRNYITMPECKAKLEDATKDWRNANP